MCGIAGGFHHDLSPAGEQQILQSLALRGPDSQGLWRRPGIWLANTRLAIQDLSPAGRQPMLSDDGNYCLVYNGELYHADALREELIKKGAHFRSQSDTEVLLQAYIEWGAECLNHLEGDFAFALWDERKQQLFLARDPLGVKPLYLYQKGSCVLFASRLPALRSLPGLDFSLCPEVFADYLSFLYSPSEATPFRHTRKLLPGHCLSLSLNDPQVQPRRYYHIPMRGRSEPASPQGIADMEQCLQTVVQSQLRADVPVGIMLSGGLDSSLIAALVKRSAWGGKLQAFCVDTGSGLSQEGFDDDLPYARQVARHLGLPLQEIPGAIQPSALWIDAMIRMLGEPQADPAAWYVGQIAAAARQAGVKVLLSGAGGDDVFSGYRRHLALPAFKMLRALPSGLGSWARFLPAGSPGARRIKKLIAAAGKSPLSAALHSHLWTEPAVCFRLMHPDLHPANPTRLLEQMLEEIPEEHRLLQQMLFLEQRSFLPQHNLAYTDQMCMEHSVEARVPFSDRRIVDRAATLPPEWKLRGQSTKWILREIARPWLPKEICLRRKTGFGAPLRSWIQGPLQPLLRERLLSPGFLQWGIFQPAAIENLISEQAAVKTDPAYTLFSLLCIESWLRQFGSSA